jgi:glycosyltransferase involved in cell wall biosynthesis
MTRKRKLISLVVPVFNEDEKTLLEFSNSVNALISTLRSFKFEILLIDDSTNSQSKIYVRNLCKQNSWRGIFFTRNFGKEAAMRAGLEHASGDAIVILDVDLQDPIELIPKMIELWENKRIPIVLTKRIDRKSDSFGKRFSSKLFYNLINMLSDINLPMQSGDFRLIDRRVVQSTLLLNEKNLFMKGIWSWVGYEHVVLEFIRPARENGQSKFPVKKLITVATDAIVSFSTLPIRIWSYVGLTLAGLSMIFGLFVAYMRITGTEMATGYASLVVISTLSLSLNLICFGIFGEYLSRIFLEVKARPHYIILEEIK